MRFNALSEKEVKTITALLDSEKISYEVIYDEHTLKENDHFIKNNIKYIHAGSFKTNILALDIKDDDFEKMSLSLKNELIEYGISIEIPDEFQNITFGQIDHSDLNKNSQGMYSSKNVYGAIIIVACTLLIKYFL